MRLIACLLLLLLTAFALPMTVRPAVAADARKIEQAIPAIDRLFADFQVDSHAPGLVYGIVANGRLVHVRAFGVQDLVQRRPATPDSLFRIASMTKAFTALAILKLREEGRLGLDDLAARHVPEMRGWTYPTEDSPPIRIRDLLTHSAGFVDDNPWGDRQTPMSQGAFTRMLAQGVPLSSAPATRYEYSNFGYALLGRIVANASGQSYRRYVERTLLTPLGMASSGYEVREAPAERRAMGYRWEEGRWKVEPDMGDGAFGAMGGLQTSATDYARWVAFLLSAWPARDGKDDGPLSRASVRMLAQGSNHVVLAQRNGKSGVGACGQAAAYGFGMRVAQDCDLGLTLFHGGGYPGYGSHVMLMPDYGVGIFVFTNRTYTGGAGPAWDAAMLLKQAGALTEPTKPVSALLAEGYGAAGRIYAAGSVDAARDRLAMNFLMDADATSWAKKLAAIRAEAGACATDAPITPTGNLSGRFLWTCDKGRVEGTLLLAPTPDAQIQELTLRVRMP